MDDRATKHSSPMTMTTTHLNSRNVTFCQPSSFVSLTSVALFQLFRCVARAIVLRAWGQVISNQVPLSCSTRHLHHCHGIAFAFLNRSILACQSFSKGACTKAPFHVPGVFEPLFLSFPLFLSLAPEPAGEGRARRAASSHDFFGFTFPSNIFCLAFASRKTALGIQPLPRRSSHI